MCVSPDRIQEGSGSRFEISNKGKQMSDADSTPRVEMYTKWGCGFCARAKALLGSKGVEFEEYDITMGGPKRDEMLGRSNGGTTVPQIFIGGVHVGGSDDLAALERTGKLDMLLGR
jgi:glutaredoxin 3